MLSNSGSLRGKARQTPIGGKMAHEDGKRREDAEGIEAKDVFFPPRPQWISYRIAEWIAVMLCSRSAKRSGEKVSTWSRRA